MNFRRSDDLDLSDSARRWRRVLVLVTWLAALLAAGLSAPLTLSVFLLPFFPAGLPVAFGYSGLEVGCGFIALAWLGYGLLTFAVLASLRGIVSWSAWVLLAVLLAMNASGCHHGHFQ